MTLIDRDVLLAEKDNHVSFAWGEAITVNDIENADTVPAIPIKTIEKYLINLINERYGLGKRRFGKANIQVYNYIRACLDDLEEYKNGKTTN